MSWCVWSICISLNNLLGGLLEDHTPFKKVRPIPVDGSDASRCHRGPYSFTVWSPATAGPQGQISTGRSLKKVLSLLSLGPQDSLAYFNKVSIYEMIIRNRLTKRTQEKDKEAQGKKCFCLMKSWWCSLSTTVDFIGFCSLTLNLNSCLSFLSARITGVHHHTRLKYFVLSILLLVLRGRSNQLLRRYCFGGFGAFVLFYFETGFLSGALVVLEFTL